MGLHLPFSTFTCTVVRDCCSDCDLITGQSHYRDGIVEIVPQHDDDVEYDFSWNGSAIPSSADAQDVAELQVPHVPLPNTCVHPSLRVRPYACHVCKSTFGRLGQLSAHVAGHSTEEAFSGKRLDRNVYALRCNTCKKHILDASKLRRHLEVYNNERPFECEVCVEFLFCCLSCASGCVVECQICNRKVAGSNLGMGYFAPRYTLPSIPPGSVNEYQLRLGRQRQVWLIPIADERVSGQVKL